MHQLIASPFLGQYLLLRPGHAKGVAIPESRFEELHTAVTKGRPAPAWLAEATTAAWQMPMPAGPCGSTLLVRERSTYGYAQASWEINNGCDYDCRTATSASSGSRGCRDDKIRLLDIMRDAGVLWLQITGGEPLIDREFPAVYSYAMTSG